MIPLVARRAVSHLLASTSAPAGASVSAARAAERWFSAASAAAAAAAEPEPVAETAAGGGEFGSESEEKRAPLVLFARAFA